MNSTAARNVSLAQWTLSLGALVLGVILLLLASRIEASLGWNPVFSGIVLVGVGIFATMYALKAAFPDAKFLPFQCVGVLLTSAVCLLTFETGFRQALQVETDVLGWIALIIGGGTGIYALKTMRPSTSAAYGEKLAAIALIANGFIGGYLLYKLQALRWDTDSDNRTLWSVIVVIVLIGIAEGIVIELIAKRDPGDVVEDERDLRIRDRAGRNAHTVLLIGLIHLVVILGFFPDRWSPWTSTTAIANVLILALVASEFIRCATTLWLYRKARV